MIVTMLLHSPVLWSLTSKGTLPDPQSVLKAIDGTDPKVCGALFYL